MYGIDRLQFSINRNLWLTGAWLSAIGNFQTTMHNDDAPLQEQLYGVPKKIADRKMAVKPSTVVCLFQSFSSIFKAISNSNSTKTFIVMLV